MSRTGVGCVGLAVDSSGRRFLGEAGPDVSKSIARGPVSMLPPDILHPKGAWILEPFFVLSARARGPVSGVI